MVHLMVHAVKLPFPKGHLKDISRTSQGHLKDISRTSSNLTIFTGCGFKSLGKVVSSLSLIEILLEADKGAAHHISRSQFGKGIGQCVVVFELE